MAQNLPSASMTLLISIAVLTVFSKFAISDNVLCGTVCACENDEDEGFYKVDCSRSYLSIVPPADDWPRNVTHMELSFNNISALDKEFAHDTLEALDLSHNKISKLAQNAFGGLFKLQYLNLANNMIKQFDEDGFYGLDHLKSLNISSNGLRSLPDRLFYNFIGLQELSLSDNPLVHIDPIHFNKMINLRWLDLSNTDIYSLEAKTFHTTEALEFLDLSANDFHKIPTDALRSAKRIRHLRLNENPLDVLDKTSFLKLSTLEVLQLNNLDHLKEVKEETFSDLVGLEVLEIRYNRQLRTLHRDAFMGLFNDSRPTLQELDLEGNEIRSLDKDMVACARMRKFNVQKNPWLCDCTTAWIKQCQIPRVFSADLRCHEPGRVADALIINMSEKDFDCVYAETAIAKSMVHHEHVARTVTVGMAAGFLVVLAFGIALVFKWRDMKTWYRNRRRGPGAVYYVKARSNPRVI